MSDGSYIAFMELDNAKDAPQDKGLVFSGSLAEELFNYYKSFV